MSDNGSPVTQYKVLMRPSDFSTYSEVLDDWDGSDPALILARTCKVPFSTLLAVPFTLTEGASVFAKIIAVNQIGES